MLKIFAISFIYVVTIILLIVFKCWIVLGTIYGLGIIAFMYSIMTAKNVLKNLMISLNKLHTYSYIIYNTLKF